MLIYNSSVFAPPLLTEYTRGDKLMMVQSAFCDLSHRTPIDKGVNSNRAPKWLFYGYALSEPESIPPQGGYLMKEINRLLMRLFLLLVVVSVATLATHWGLTEDKVASFIDKVKSIATDTEENITETNDYMTLFNRYRQDNGLSPLVFTDDLNKNAKLRVEELKIYFSHNSQGGYNKCLAENIIKGVHSDQGALSVWNNSSGHRTNMLDGSYKYTGYAIGGGYAIQLFTPYQTINGEPQLPPSWHWNDDKQ